MTERSPTIPAMGTDKAKFMIYMDPAYKEALGQLAATENRSMSNFVETLIINAVDQARAQGIIPSPNPKGADNG